MCNRSIAFPPQSNLGGKYSHTRPTGLVYIGRRWVVYIGRLWVV